jgi:hypothetical protein
MYEARRAPLRFSVGCARAPYAHGGLLWPVSLRLESLWQHWDEVRVQRHAPVALLRCTGAGARGARGRPGRAGLLFDWLYPAHMPTLLCCLEAWADCPEVTTAALKFMGEFVLNKTQRLTFDASSPNGILLFREVSKVLPAPGYPTNPFSGRIREVQGAAREVQGAACIRIPYPTLPSGRCPRCRPRPGTLPYPFPGRIREVQGAAREVQGAARIRIPYPTPPSGRCPRCRAPPAHPLPRPLQGRRQCVCRGEGGGRLPEVLHGGCWHGRVGRVATGRLPGHACGSGRLLRQGCDGAVMRTSCAC